MFVYCFLYLNFADSISIDLMKRVVIIFLSIITALLGNASKMDSLQWRVGMELSPAYVIPTNSSLKGDNLYGDKV